MRRRTTLLVLVLALVAVAVGVTGTVNADSGVDANNPTPDAGPLLFGEHVADCAAEPPEDFADPEDGNDVIGWVDGFWYNEPLGFTVDDDGITESELEALSARTAARFEAMRCITATDGVPTVEIQSREEFQEEQEGIYTDAEPDVGLFDNAMFKTMLLVGSDENSLEVREANRGETVGGFYNFVEERIVVVSDDPDTLLIDEEILAHELGHAIQDQQFNLSRFDRPTTDIDKGKLALIEGDVHLVEGWYLEACEAGMWDEPCVTEEVGEGGAGGDLASFGIYFKSWQPYNDGPAFVEYMREELGDGGWEAIDQLYEEPPDSALYTAFPEKFGEVERADVEVPDESEGDWERLTFNDSVDYNTLGVAGISAMIKEPTFETGAGFNILDPLEIQNVTPQGELDQFQPFNYANEVTEGWRDDKLYAYANDEDEVGSVWKLQWASDEEAETFVDAYEELIEFRVGDLADGYTNVYEFDRDYDMVVAVDTEGGTVTIVTAPTVDDLAQVHDVELLEADDADDEPADPDDTDDADDGPVDPADDDAADPDDTDADAADPTDVDDDGAGFGVVAATVALVVATLLARRHEPET